MKPLALVSLFLFVLAIVVACVDDDDGRQACESLATKCLPVGKTAKCSRVEINAAPNGSEVEDCVQAATECDAATACLDQLPK